jgi:hypothetical protein
MNPLVVVPATAIARFGPYFGRVVSSNPGILVRLINALRKTGAVIEPSVSAVIAYVKAHPLNAATVFATLAGLGVAISDLFDSSDKADPAVRSSAAVLDAAVASAHGHDLPKAVLKAAASSEALNPETASAEDTHVLREVCSWAQGFFGSPSRAMEAHALLQGFLELPRAKAQYAFDNLRLGR